MPRTTFSLSFVAHSPCHRHSSQTKLLLPEGPESSLLLYKHPFLFAQILFSSIPPSCFGIQLRCGHLDLAEEAGPLLYVPRGSQFIFITAPAMLCDTCLSGYLPAKPYAIVRQALSLPLLGTPYFPYSRHKIRSRDLTRRWTSEHQS